MSKEGTPGRPARSLRSLAAEVTEATSIYARTLRLGWRISPRLVLVSLSLHAAAGLLPVAEMWLVKLFIDQIAAAVAGARASHPVAIQPLLLLIAAQAALFFLKQVNWIYNLDTREMLGHLMQQEFNLRILRKATQLDLAFFETPIFYDQMENAKRSIGNVNEAIQQGLQMLQAGVGLVLILVVLVRLHWLVAVGAVIITLPYLYGFMRFLRHNWSVLTSRAPERRRLDYYASILTERDWAKELRIFDLGDLLLGRTRSIWQKFFAENERLVMMRSRMTLLFGTVTTLGLAGGTAYVVFRAINGTITVGDVALYFSALTSTLDYLIMTFVRVGYTYEMSLGVKNLFAFLDLDAQAVEGSLQQTEAVAVQPASTPTVPPTIEFRDVDFRYPGTDRTVLQGVSFTIPAGTRFALVGENGAGKTTLVKLLLRLYDPTAGQILLDGVDLREYGVAALRRLFSVVFQDFNHYDFTVRENIGFGDLHRLDDLAQIQRAAEMVGASRLVEKLPQGYDTLLGRTFEGGLDLSGGEWQMLALGRGFMRESPIMILDEPTAALDARAEHALYDRIGGLTSGRTTLFISHRFSTTRMADRIVVLVNGKVAEEGTHDELLTQAGTYATLFHMQAERYQTSNTEATDS